MAEPKFDPALHATLDKLLLPLPGVTPGKMFGFPAYYVSRKLVACVYGRGVGVKVPEAYARELLTQPHVTPFQPMGKPKMREWVQLNRERYEDHAQDLAVFEAAVAYAEASAR